MNIIWHRWLYTSGYRRRSLCCEEFILSQNKTNLTLVWDIPVRLFHWSLVVTLIGMWVTSDQDLGLIEYHIIGGYIALSLVLYRLIWGFVGTHYAKFSTFVPSLESLKRYLTGGDPNRKFYGHNPLGSLMVLAMLVLILLQAVSGLFISDDVFSAGPYNSIIDKEFERVFGFIHHNGFDVLIAAVAIHVMAIFYHEGILRQPLIKAMVTGKKLTIHSDKVVRVKHSKLVTALIILIGVALFVYWLVVINAPIVDDYAF